VDREFNIAANRDAYEKTRLSNAERKQIEAISERQKIESKRLLNDQKARFSKDISKAEREILAKKSRPELTPDNFSKSNLTRKQLSLQARKLVTEKNQQEANRLNQKFEQQKAAIIDKKFSEERRKVENASEQRKFDRQSTNIFKNRNRNLTR